MLTENTGLMFSNSIMNTSDSNTQDISGMAMDSTDNFATTSDYDNFYPSSPESASEDSGDLMKAAMKDEVTAQLAASGPIGAAAAAAIISGKKRKHLHSFETNPSVRKRQQNRMLRKLKQIIDEFTIRVGQQAVVLVATPGKQSSYKVFGAKPLETIIKDLKSVIIEKLEAALAYQAPSPLQEDPSLFGLPPLVIDGIPTPVEKMTQAQLRAFIPLMLRYSTGRGKPGWGRESTRPPWWPIDLPWANVRMDARTEDEKQKTSWTHALKQIVINCYKYHGREDLLPAFTEEGETVYEVSQNELNPEDLKIPVSNSAPAQYIPTSVLHSIADGTVNIIQVDPNNPVITLADGTTAQIQGLQSLVKKELSTELEANNLLVDVNSSQGIPVHTIQTISEEDLNSIAEATLNSDGHIILTGEDGNSYPISMNNIITIPTSMLQTIEANMQHGNSDGILQVAIPKIELNSEDNAEGLTLNCDNLVSQPMIIHTSGTDLPQVLKVMSLKDARALAKQNVNITNVNIEEPIGSLTLAME